MVLEKKLLKISGALKCIMGVLLLHPYGFFLVCSGVFLYYMSFQNEEKIYRYNVLNLLIGIFGIFDLIGSIILFIALGLIQGYSSHRINAPPKVSYRLSKEQRKIDILLKIGVLMVFLSGLLFATTSWTFISNPIKVVALILFGCIFIALSLFVENKFQLYRSSFLYWLLGLALFVFSIIGAFYFNIFGGNITFSGIGKSLAYSIVFLSISGFALVTYFKYPKKVFLYAFYFSLFLMISSLFDYLKMSPLMVVCIISFVVMILNILNRRSESLKIFSVVMSYLLFAFIIRVDNSSNITLLITCIVNLINFNYLTIINKDDHENILHIVLSYFLILIAIYRTDVFGVYSHFISGLTVSLYSILLFSNVIPVMKQIKKLLFIVYAFFITYIILASLEHFYAILLSVVFIFIIEMIQSGSFDFDSLPFAKNFEPLGIYTFVLSIMFLFDIDYSLMLLYATSITVALYCVLLRLYQNKSYKNLYSIVSIIGIVFALCISSDYSDLFPSIILMISSLYLFLNYYFNMDVKKDNIAYTAIYYFLLLLTHYIPFVYCNILGINEYLVSVLMIVLIIIIAAVLRDKIITKISCFGILLPLCHMMNIMNLGYDYEAVLGSIIGLYIVFLVLTFFVKAPLLRNIVTIISLFVFLVDLFFMNSSIIGIYVGIIGIIAMIFGFFKNEYYPIFIAGIVITILNIFYRLFDFWKAIPFWLYLLIGGLAIIAFVTFREIKKQKNSIK